VIAAAVPQVLILANTARTVGYVIAAVVFIGFLVYAWAVYRQARPEAGSEIELAANRKPYYDDDELETSRLDRTLALALGMVTILALALPLYWLGEPGRMDGWIEQWDETFIHNGEHLYEEACASCHGPAGVGGVSSFTLTTPEGEFLQQVEWQAPALDTVLARYSVEEVTFILQYGRANTPMPAWGTEGGGPMTSQQLEELVAYIESLQISEADMRTQVEDALVSQYVSRRIATEADEQDLDDEAEADRRVELADEVRDRLAEGVYDLNADGAWSREELGEAMFNLDVAAGAYSCARCHTKGWSYGQPEVPGGGFLGPNLTGGSTLRQFETFEEHVAFITQGAQRGAAYGAGGLSGAGQMPGYGFNPNAEDSDTLEPEQFMYTQEQIEAVVAYERSL
jgi:mono/diheme cytochrome c family protein